MSDAHLLAVILPVILLLGFGVLAAMLSRALRLSPIVGYIVLGVGLHAAGLSLFSDGGTVGVLAELGVVFLLFDIGLHFSLSHVRSQASDIFGFGAVQVVFGTLGLALIALAFHVPLVGAVLIGATLALSSTAVVAGIIAERHQQNCPVGLTATAILVFQDVAAIFLLILANALSHGTAGLGLTLLFALGKAVLAFGAAVILARLVIRPLFDLVAKTRNEEVLTAMALLIALAAGYATGRMGLSLTLGAFLGGMIVAETPYRPLVHSEINAFRGLLLSFFFMAVGLQLDLQVLLHAWPFVILVAVLMIAAKVMLNAAASLVFRWSVPGSIQLGFLLSQGSEFAFVILSLPAVRILIGDADASILVVSVALTLALTPSLAEAGRRIAGRMRARRMRPADPELVQQSPMAPVLIVGMGAIGRTLADALTAFAIGYDAIERDQQRLADAIADGYNAAFGDGNDLRLWGTVNLAGRRLVALTAPDYEFSSGITPISRTLFPAVKRFAALAEPAEAERWTALGAIPIIEHGLPRGAEFATAILTEFGIDQGATDAWRTAQQARLLQAA